MIHSMSGGVLSQNDEYDFAKVRVDGVPRWYLSIPGAAAGTRVLVPFAGTLREGTVERVERCSVQTAPVSLKRAQRIEAVLQNP